MLYASSRLLLVALLVASGVGCSSSSSSDDDGGSGGNDPGTRGPGGDAEPASLTGITAAHNAVRAAVDPTAAMPLPALTWSSTIAAVAQAHAEKCTFEHDLSSGYGENLHANTGSDTPDDVVAAWGAEAARYDYDANQCSGTCGHYTQVVWAATLHLGCGVAQCTTNSPFNSSKTWQSWVCNYDPPGNFGDARPY